MFAVGRRGARAGLGVPACPRLWGLVSAPSRPPGPLFRPPPGRKDFPKAPSFRARAGSAEADAPPRAARSESVRDETRPPSRRRRALAGPRSGFVPVTLAPVVGRHLAAAFISPLPSSRSCEGRDLAAVAEADFQEAGGAAGIVPVAAGRRGLACSPETGAAGLLRERWLRPGSGGLPGPVDQRSPRRRPSDRGRRRGAGDGRWLAAGRPSPFPAAWPA